MMLGLLVCAEDARTCPNGSILARDPARGCAFPDCPATAAEMGSTLGTTAWLAAAALLVVLWLRRS